LATAVRALKDAVTDELEKLFRTHNASVLRAAFRITGSLADAEDVAQLVFLRLARDDLDHSRISDIGSYLRRAAANAALDVLRSRKTRPQVSIEAAASLSSGAQLSPEQGRSAMEARQRIREALASLHPNAAEMFVLRYFEELDNREIARLMQTSQAVVAVTLHRARARLRKELREFAR
jgi:RNA polymerase sigma factor (sigma-70 family)